MLPTKDLKEGIEKHGVKAFEDALAKEESEHAVKSPENRKEIAERFKAVREQLRKIVASEKVTEKEKPKLKEKEVVPPEGKAVIPLGRPHLPPKEESIRDRAIDLITKEKVERFEKRGFEIVEGELKKGTPEYTELMVTGAGISDKFMDTGLTIQKKRREKRGNFR